MRNRSCNPFPSNSGSVFMCLSIDYTRCRSTPRGKSRTDDTKKPELHDLLTLDSQSCPRSSLSRLANPHLQANLVDSPWRDLGRYFTTAPWITCSLPLGHLLCRASAHSHLLPDHVHIPHPALPLLSFRIRSQLFGRFNKLHTKQTLQPPVAKEVVLHSSV